MQVIQNIEKKRRWPITLGLLFTLCFYFMLLLSIYYKAVTVLDNLQTLFYAFHFFMQRRVQKCLCAVYCNRDCRDQVQLSTPWPAGSQALHPCTWWAVHSQPHLHQLNMLLQQVTGKGQRTQVRCSIPCVKTLMANFGIILLDHKWLLSDIKIYKKAVERITVWQPKWKDHVS